MATQVESQADITAPRIAGRGQKVGYLMSRFPKLTETFVLYEMLAMEQLGLDVEIFPLIRERCDFVHGEAERLIGRANYTPLLCSWALLSAHLFYLLRSPGPYFRALAALLRANWGSRRYFFGAVAFFPKGVLLARMMSQRKIDHLHAHFASHPAAVAFLVHRLTGIPYSFTAHGSDLHRDRHMLREKVAEASFVRAISEYNRRMILEECGPAAGDKVAVLHCGVDTDRFRPQARKTPFDEGCSPFTIVCIGSLHEVKGQRYLVEACEILRSRGIDVACHLVGDGPDRRSLAKQASAAALSGCIHFHGKQTQDELQRLLRTADVVAAPSVATKCGRREGIPVALMEASATAVAAVASDLSGIPELVEDGRTGVLVRPGDSVALADSLERLYRDPALRHDLGRRGREKVEREFNLAANATELAGRFQTAEGNPKCS